MAITLSSRLAACLLASVGCAPPHLETREPVGPEPPVWRDDSHLAELRTTLGRAGLSLKLGATDDAAWFTTSCRETKEARDQPSCARCDLASETNPTDDTVLDAARRALELYPAEFLTASGITGIALCRRLTYVDVRSDPVFTGTVDLHAGLLLISVESFERGYDPAAPYPIDAIIHHELFHQLEFGRMHRAWADDPEWRLHNPLGFEYQDREPDARPPGFVSTYAATNAWEDRATVFEWIMTRPEALCVSAADDPVVRDKVGLLWSRVAALADDRFLRRRAPCIDWIDRPETATPTAEALPFRRDLSFRPAPSEQYLRPPSR